MRVGNMIPWRRRRTLPVGDRPRSAFLDEFDELFERFFQPGAGFPTEFFGGVNGEFGAVDVTEKNGKFAVKIDLPGVEESDIDLQVSDHRLTVRATREREQDDETNGYHHVERVFGSFARSIEMPDEVDPNTAHATFRDGVLEVVLDKSPTAIERTRKIAIGG